MAVLHHHRAKVQANLVSMQKFNDFVYDTAAVNKVTNAYLLLSEQDNSDPGVTIGLNLLESAFRAIGSFAGPAGTFAASFLSGLLFLVGNAGEYAAQS